MKFTCQKSDLSEVLTNVAKATSYKTPMESLGSIRMEVFNQELTLTGYDLELGIQTKIPAVVEIEGVLLADSRLFCEIVRRMPDGALTIENDDHLKITITGDETSFQLAGMNADDYPDLPNIEASRGAVIPQSLLKSMIDQTIYAVSLDETKPIFTGELIEIADGMLNVVALDNYRMALRTEALLNQEEMKFVVPAKAMREIQHLLQEDEKNENPCTIQLDQNHALFTIRNYTVYTRLLAGEFINYRRSIPTTSKTEILVQRRELMECLERCALLISEQNKTGVRFEIEENRVMVSCQNVVGSIDDVISCAVTGEKMVIGFNNRYLLEAVRSIQGDRVKLLLTAPDRAVRIQEGEGENTLALVMPVHVRH
ncbi:MAG: DNA polymerase III subunit beta [Oscillospiraceae bacterium]|nr:DNA polymerase III subunit beta [Oscillospiraceae bacterium]